METSTVKKGETVGFKVVRKVDLKTEQWGVGTGKFERSIAHILTPAMGSKHCWFAYQETPPGKMGQWHHHSYDEFYYVLKGTATVTGSDGVGVEIGPGDTIFIPAGTRHQTTNTGSETFAFVFAYVPPPQSVTEKAWIETTAASAGK